MIGRIGRLRFRTRNSAKLINSRWWPNSSVLVTVTLVLKLTTKLFVSLKTLKFQRLWKVSKLRGMLFQEIEVKQIFLYAPYHACIKQNVVALHLKMWFGLFWRESQYDSNY